MTDLRTAAQQALEALEEATNYTGCETWSPSMTDECLAVAAALRAALEQPEQEPVAWRLPDPDPEGRFEWVLYQTADFMPGVNPMDHFDGLEPLYTHPPRREWRGLSEQERHRLWRKLCEGEGLDEYAEAIEAALKERNV
jgi:hypothetical protein